VFHEAIAVVAAVVYALLFELGGAGNLWLWGLIGNLVHYLIAGPVVAAIPSLDPATGRVGAQGFAYRNYGGLDAVRSEGLLSWGAT
jgi:drug/metabolite transporter superfamily protein YnfA